MRKIVTASVILISMCSVLGCNQSRSEVKENYISQKYLLAYIESDNKIINYNELEFMGMNDNYIEFKENNKVETKSFGEIYMDVDADTNKNILILDNRVVNFNIQEDTCVIEDLSGGNNLKIIYKTEESKDWELIKEQEISFEQDIKEKLERELELEWTKNDNGIIQ